MLVVVVDTECFSDVLSVSAFVLVFLLFFIVFMSFFGLVAE